MLGVLCARPKAWLLASLSLFYTHGSSAAHIQSRLVQSPTTVLRSVVFNGVDQRRHHSSNCRLGVDPASRGGAASIWHAILPAGGKWRQERTTLIHHHDYELMKKGEGSWNAAWDARPARWLHNPDSAWLLFGVCACLATPPPPSIPSVTTAPSPSAVTAFDISEVGVRVDDKVEGHSSNNIQSDVVDHSSAIYKVKGVPADGRCLFRAIAHMACLRNGEEAPDENRQRELADDLRAQVVDELLRRRKEAEWFIEGDFDAYVKRIQQPYVWGGEPELLMASHVLKTPISVFMIDRSSGGLSKIADYGEEYRKDEESPINVLFHGYGHYDILEAISDQSYQKIDA